MSYSISATRATKTELQEAINDELRKVLDTQPVHAVDIIHAADAAGTFIDLVQDDPARDLYCSISGSIWTKDGYIESVGVSVNVTRADRK